MNVSDPVGAFFGCQNVIATLMLVLVCPALTLLAVVSGDLALAGVRQLDGLLAFGSFSDAYGNDRQASRTRNTSWLNRERRIRQPM